MSVTSSVEHGVLLSSLTTLQLGGPAHQLLQVERSEDIADICSSRDVCRLNVLGGGSNVVASDAGVDGLILLMRNKGIHLQREGDALRISAKAGEVWDGLVKASVDEGFAGLECLSGIPGTVGAAPIQNIGAYGQELSDCVSSVEVYDLTSSASQTFPAEACAFGYRNSHFKRHSDRYVVTRVEFLLTRKTPTVSYPELVTLMDSKHAAPGVEEVRAAVLELRARKSMLLTSSNHAWRTAGSFFLNPVLDPAAFRALVKCLGAFPPHFRLGDAYKVSAAWLIEHAGFRKGMRQGSVGLSPHHALALICYEGATSKALLKFAQEIQAQVERVGGIKLVMEPVKLGF